MTQVEERVASPAPRLRRDLARSLRRLREEAGLTLAEAAEQLECSPSKISRIENNHVEITPRDVRDLLAAYGTPEKIAAGLVTMARGAHQYGSAKTSVYAGLEAVAEEIRSYEARMVPSLLQTDTYAQAITFVTNPDITAERNRRRQRDLTARRTLVTRSGLVLRVVLDEAVAMRQVGGPAVFRDQLTHLLSMASLPNVTVQILPFSVGEHAAMAGSFSMLMFDEGEPAAVFIEGAGERPLDDTRMTERRTQMFDQLRKVALPPDDSAALIAERTAVLPKQSATSEHREGGKS